MRGNPDPQLAMLTSLSTEDLIPADHPIRRIRVVVDVVLAELDGEFDAMYATAGRPSVPPEQLLKATVLMALYSIRSERAFCERLNYDLLFKWFLDLRIDAAGVRRDDVHEEPSTAAGARDRRPVLRRGGAPGQAAPLRVVGPLLRRRDAVGGVGVAQELQTQRRPDPTEPPAGRNTEVDFHGEKRSNDTHAVDHRPRGPPVSQEQQHRRRRCATRGIC